MSLSQHLSVVTIGTEDMARSRRFYRDGFGWVPALKQDEITFYQLNGMLLGTFALAALEADMGLSGLARPAAVALAHNVGNRGEVEPLMERLVQAGGRIVREASEPPHGGYRGYVLDPDGHAWEIAFNEMLVPDANGNIQFPDEL